MSCSQKPYSNLYAEPNKTTFKYHATCTDGKISVRINLLFYLFLTAPSNISCRPVVVNTFSTGLVGVEVSSVSWLGQLSGQNGTIYKVLPSSVI